MAKEIKQIVKVQLPSGGANPSMVGTTLGPTGVNMAEFCQKFNEQTKERGGEIAPATITIYEDRSYEFILKQAPASEMIKKAAGLKKGSSVPQTDKVANLTEAQVREIAEKKMPDLNAASTEAAMRIIAGTARSMGVTVEGLEKGDN
ncbi:MAG: 50S ribosomal protein L11 [Mycoplasmatales bacterium]